MTEARTPCAVPFCHRSKRGRWAWWLCPTHYKGVSLAARARHRKAKALCKRRGWIGTTKTTWWPTTDRARRLMDVAGRAVIRAACKAATGL
jgi:hypothetical protein